MHLSLKHYCFHFLCAWIPLRTVYEEGNNEGFFRSFGSEALRMNQSVLALIMPQFLLSLSRRQYAEF